MVVIVLQKYCMEHISRLHIKLTNTYFVKNCILFIHTFHDVRLPKNISLNEEGLSFVIFLLNSFDNFLGHYEGIPKTICL